MKGQIQTKNMVPSKRYFRILVHDANLLAKNMGAKFCFKTRIPSTLAQNDLYELRNDFKPNYSTLARDLSSRTPKMESEKNLTQKHGKLLGKISYPKIWHAHPHIRML